jgi:hypothetical protein
VTFIDDFLTPEFVDRYKMYHYRQDPATGRMVVVNRDFRRDQADDALQLTNHGQPFIYVVDGNYANRGELYLAHKHIGFDLDIKYRQRMPAKPASALAAAGAPAGPHRRRHDALHGRWRRREPAEDQRGAARAGSHVDCVSPAYQQFAAAIHVVQHPCVIRLSDSRPGMVNINTNASMIFARAGSLSLVFDPHLRHNPESVRSVHLHM